MIQRVSSFKSWSKWSAGQKYLEFLGERANRDASGAPERRTTVLECCRRVSASTSLQKGPKDDWREDCVAHLSIRGLTTLANDISSLPAHAKQSERSCCDCATAGRHTHPHQNTASRNEQPKPPPHHITPRTGPYDTAPIHCSPSFSGEYLAHFTGAWYSTPAGDIYNQRRAQRTQHHH